LFLDRFLPSIVFFLQLPGHDGTFLFHTSTALYCCPYLIAMADSRLFDGIARWLNDPESLDPVIPTYTITRGVDGILQFNPPVDDGNLAIALSYHFPKPNTLQGKMQAAILKFLQDSTGTSKSIIETTTTEIQDAEVGHAQLTDPMLIIESTFPWPAISPNTVLWPDFENMSSDDPVQGSLDPAHATKRTSSNDGNPSSSKRTQMTSEFWVLNPKTGHSQKSRVKRKYGTLEAKQVFKNRGNACQHHRRMKSKASSIHTLTRYHCAGTIPISQ
jgi:hypothetical protein